VPGKTEGHVRLLRLGESGIRAAQYLTELPPRKILERKLLDAIQLARERIARHEVDELENKRSAVSDQQSVKKKTSG